MKNKGVLVFICMFMVMLITLSSNVFAAEKLKGDLNNDGKVDLVDVFLTYNNYLKMGSLPEEKIEISDINNDNKVDLVDVFLVYNVYLKSSVTTVPVSGITITPTSKTLEVGQTFSLQAEVLPSNATNKEIEWYSENEVVATVNQGTVKASSVGTTNIVAKSKDGSFEAKCKITVIQNPVSITLNKETLNLKVDENEKLTWKISPDNSTDKNVTWSTSNKDVANVSGGTITAKSVGDAIITAKTVNGKTATCKVTVSAKDVPVTGITITPTSKTLEAGQTFSLQAEVLPSNATNKEIEWYSENEVVATVSQGTVKASSVGTTNIVAKSKDGSFEAKCKITVIQYPVSITLNKETLNLKVDENEKLTWKILPDNSIDKTVTWSTSNKDVAIVSGGTITAKSVGDAIITAKTVNGKTATCKVTVSAKNVPVTGITITPTSKTLEVGQTTSLQAEVLPSNATNKEIEWYSENEVVATVNQGTVKASSVGTTNIVAKSKDGSFEAKCKITVIQNPVSITLNKETLNLKVDENEKLTWKISPDNSTDKNVTWSTSNKDVATVSGGTITAKSVGDAIITAKTVNGKTATCKVTVSAKDVPVTGITITPTSKTLEVGQTTSLQAEVLPSNATNKEIEWYSENEVVATVSQGTVKASSVGTTNIVAKSKDGSFEAKCKITVIQYPVNITLDKTEINLLIGGKAALTKTIVPENSINKSVTWSTSNKDVATVSAGTITAQSAGEAIITAKTVNGKTATCKVIVSKNMDLKVEDSANSDVVLGGSTITYKISTKDYGEDVVFDESKISVTYGDKIGETGTEVSSGGTGGAEVVPTITNKGDYIELKVKTYNDSLKSGYYTINMKSGTATTSSGVKNSSLILTKYVACLDLNASNDSITAIVGVHNSFQIKSYNYYLDNELKSEENTTNEYTFDAVSGNTYTISVNVSFYIDKNGNEYVKSGTIKRKVTVPRTSNGIEVYYIDVNYSDEENLSADSIFLRAKQSDGTYKTMLIDMARDDEITVNKIHNVLKKLVPSEKDSNGNTVRKIDYVLVTHFDIDHYGGFSKLTGIVADKTEKKTYVDNSATNKINNERCYYSFGKYIVSSNYKEFINGINMKSTIVNYAKDNNKLMTVRAGNYIKLGSATLNIFAPYPYESVHKEWLVSTEKDSTSERIDNTLWMANGFYRIAQTSQNNDSIVLKICVGKDKNLLTGDSLFYTEELLTGKVAEETKVLNSDRYSMVKWQYAISNPNFGLAIKEKHDFDGTGTTTEKEQYINLVADLRNKYTDDQIEAFKLQRLTKKDISAQILKKGHHSTFNSTSVDFLKLVNPDKIVITGLDLEHGLPDGKAGSLNSTFTSLNTQPAIRIREYYKSKGITFNSSNWTNYVIGINRSDVAYQSAYKLSTTGNGWVN